jgi:hypothetical protein
MNWCLSCSSLWACDLGLFLVIGNRWNSSSCSPVLGVLGCSWCLVTYPAVWSMTELGFTVEKVLYGWPLLLWSTAPPFPLVTHCVCVLHAHSLVSRLCVCVAWCCALGLGEDQLGWSLCISSLFQFFANLPSGIATWHNVLFVLFVCRDQAIDQDGPEDHQVQDQVKMIL